MSTGKLKLTEKILGDIKERSETLCRPFGEDVSRGMNLSIRKLELLISRAEKVFEKGGKQWTS